jgi:hypothetical protein
MRSWYGNPRVWAAAGVASLGLALAPVVEAGRGGNRPGSGFGDVNHCHTGPPGQTEKTGPKALCLPPAPGSADLRHATAEAHASGHFPHFDSRSEGEEGEVTANETRAGLVPGAPVRGSLAPAEGSSSVNAGPTPVPLPGLDVGLPPGATAARALDAPDPPPLVFFRNTSVKSNVSFCRPQGTGRFCVWPPDTSGANDGRIVLTTGNWVTFGALSTDGGASFSSLDPTTIFPSGPTVRFEFPRARLLDKGICCDQVVQFVPRINRFIWLMQFCGTGSTCTQGRNKLRIAAASPAEVAKGTGGSWTYWDLSSATFGLDSTKNPNMDYPDLSVGNNSLYVSVDNVNVGLLTARIPLSEIANNQTIHIDFNQPAIDGLVAYAGHLTQNVGDTEYWAGHVDNKTLRVFSMRDGEGVYSWRDVGIDSWCNGDHSSLVPGGTDWLAGASGFPVNQNAVLGAARRIDPSSGRPELWFAWGAGHAMATGTPGTCGFAQSHIQIAVLDAADYSKLQQAQVWNQNIAFAYPALASNVNGDIGMSLGYGGGGSHANHAVGIWGDFVVYGTTASDTSIGRFGDYVTIRRSGRLFSAEGYGMNQPSGTTCPVPATGDCFDPHYVLFGRPMAPPSPR